MPNNHPHDHDPLRYIQEQKSLKKCHPSPRLPLTPLPSLLRALCVSPPLCLSVVFSVFVKFVSLFLNSDFLIHNSRTCGPPVSASPRLPHHPFCSSIQNRLPCPGSDSTPTFPPIRSTFLRTSASPIPVPSYFRSTRPNISKIRAR
jgi:hypothetical protein